MKKLFLTFILLTSVAAIALGDGITSLDSLSNYKAYTVSAYSSSRGAWFYNPADGATLYSTSYAGISADYTDVNQQFAIIRSPRRGLLYFYSIGGKKFMNGPGDHYVYLTDSPVSSHNGLIASSQAKQSTHPWVAVDGDHQFNMSKNEGTGVLSSWNDINDEGNAICIEPVADFEPSEELMAKIDSFEQSFCVVNIHYSDVFPKEGYDDYTFYEYDQTIHVNTGDVINFDDPDYFFGLKSIDPTKESMTITEDQNIEVSYYYTTNKEELPFDVFNWGDFTEGFPESTPWYYVSIGSKDNYLTLGEDGTTLSTVKSDDHPIKEACLFSFDGDPLYGYYIMNKATGDPFCGICADLGHHGAANVSDTPIWFYLEHNNEGYQFNLGNDTERTAYLSTNDEGNVETYDLGVLGRTANNTTFYFTKVSDAEMEMLNNNIETLGFDSIAPEEGNIIGSLGSISVYYKGNIGKVLAEDESNLICVYNKEGEHVDSVYGQIDPEDGSCMLVNFTDSLQGDNTYTIVLPEKTIYGENGEQAQGRTLTYTVIRAFESKTVTARIWNKRIGDRIDDTPLDITNPDDSNTPIARHEVWDGIQFGDKEYLTTKIDVISKNEVKIYAFDGVEGEDLDIIYDNDVEWGDFQYINGLDRGDVAYWDIASVLTPESTANEGYIRIIADTPMGGCVGHCYPDLGYGFLCISLYDYEETKYASIYIDYYLDDRYYEEPEPEPEPDPTPDPDPDPDPDPEPGDGISGIVAGTNAPVYTLGGQRLTGNLPAGIYLRDEKKIIIK